MSALLSKCTLPASHQWGSWEYIKPGSCEQQRRCRCCQAEETRQEQHTWGDWEYIDLSIWKQRRLCLRCQAEETRVNQPTTSTDRLQQHLMARLKAGEEAKPIFDELVVAALPNSGQVMAQYQAKAILGEALLKALIPSLVLRLKVEQEEKIREGLASVYQSYLLFPDEWARRAIREARVFEGVNFVI